MCLYAALSFLSTLNTQRAYVRTQSTSALGSAAAHQFQIEFNVFVDSVYAVDQCNHLIVALFIYLPGKN